MATTNRIEKANDLEGLIDTNRWQKVQNLFAKIIGVNVSFLDPSGQVLIRSNPVAPDFSDIVVPVSGNPEPMEPPRFVMEAIRKGMPDGKKGCLVECGLHYCLLPVQWENQVLGTFVIGPVLAAKRENEDFYRKLCYTEGIHAEVFLDRIREVKLYSHTGLFLVLDFLHEMTQCFLERRSTAREFDELLPGFLAQFRGKESLLSLRFSHELAMALLDIALGLVKGDSGSVLLLEENEQCFQIQSARGLHMDVVREARIPMRSSIAGLVAQRGKPVLLHRETKDQVIKKRFVKPKLKSSFVIPLNYRDRAVGVFCLNTESENKHFNQENLQLLDQLGKIAGIAFARLGQD